MDTIVVSCLVAFIVVVWALTLWLHELAHTFAAARLGDGTAARMPRDPRDQRYPWLSYLGPLLVLALFGVGTVAPAVHLPSVRVRSRWKELLVHLAGPAVHLVLAVVCALPLAFGLEHLGEPGGPFLVLAFIVQLNVQAFIFSLVPLPTFDGWRAFSPWLPRDTDYADNLGICAGAYVLVVFLVTGGSQVGRLFYQWTAHLQLLMGAHPEWGLAAFALFYDWRIVALVAVAALAGLFLYVPRRTRRRLRGL